MGYKTAPVSARSNFEIKASRVYTGDMRYFTLLFIALFCCLSATVADARPTSYKGGWMPMLMNDGSTNSAMLLYSPSAFWAVGPFIDHYRSTDGELAGLQINWLAKRWNNPDSQGNLYLLSGWGVTNDNGDEDIGGYLGSEIDWEDRRYFVSYENRYTDATKDIKQEFEQKARIGIAPYVAEFGSLHTWLMLQVEHQPENRDHFTVTPLVRLFKGETLAEFGMNEDGEALFNLTVLF